MPIASEEPLSLSTVDPHDKAAVEELGGCGAKLRLSDPARYCRRRPLKGRKRCRLHGGRTPRGMGSPHYAGRGYSQDLPTRLLDRWEEALDDPNLTSMRSELALLDSRLGEVLGSITEDTTATRLEAATSAVHRLRYLADRPDLQDRESTLETITSDLEAALAMEQDERAAWKEVYVLIDRRRRTATVETKREDLEEHTLRHAQALYFFQRLLLAIQEEVEDPKLKAAIADRLGRELNRPDQTAPLQLPAGRG